MKQFQKRGRKKLCSSKQEVKTINLPGQRMNYYIIFCANGIETNTAYLSYFDYAGTTNELKLLRGKLKRIPESNKVCCENYCHTKLKKSLKDIF